MLTVKSLSLLHEELRTEFPLGFEKLLHGRRQRPEKPMKSELQYDVVKDRRSNYSNELTRDCHQDCPNHIQVVNSGCEMMMMMLMGRVSREFHTGFFCESLSCHEDGEEDSLRDLVEINTKL